MVGIRHYDNRWVSECNQDALQSALVIMAINRSVRPQLHGLEYPRQPFPRGNFIQLLYVKK